MLGDSAVVMNRALALLLAALAMLLPAAPALAQQTARVVTTVSWVEEWDPATGEWVRVAEDGDAGFVPDFVQAAPGSFTQTTISEEPVRFIAQTPRQSALSAGIARFGPFRVIDGKRAALVASTDAASPQAFATMLAAFPGLEVIEFADAPGTNHDLANLALGRAIRAAGLATHVPAGGSARSGAVELFLAGARRTTEPGALFAVHSWRDERGREPADFAPDAPENRLYLDYYAEMGMSPDEARAFYAMTNSVPHASALWLEAGEMERWIAPASRRIEGDAAASVRLALARLGDAVGGLMSQSLDRLASWELPSTMAAAPIIAPRLAYADPGAGLLDSLAAFP